MKPHSVIIQKTKEGSVAKDTEDVFGVVMLDIEMPETETKELEGYDWKDEDGDDVFIPDIIHESAYDFTLKVGYKGNVNTWESQMDAFVDYLTGHDGSGVEMLIYMNHQKMGRKCRLVKCPKPVPFISNNEMVVEFEVVFRVDNPRSRVRMITGTGGVSLSEVVR